MAGQLTDNDALIQEIMRLAEEAARFHGSMAGSAMFPESFIRDWVAIKLHRPEEPDRQPTFGVTIETGRGDFLEYVVDKEQHASHALLDLNNYRLDMIVWEENRPRAIIEFKRSVTVRSDIVRGRGAKVVEIAVAASSGGLRLARHAARSMH